MKSGMFRAMDGLGRIVIPMEMRRTMLLKEGDKMEVSISGNSIVFTPQLKRCAFCGQDDGHLKELGGAYACVGCTAMLIED